MPKIEERQKTLRERMMEDEDRRLMDEVRDQSLREVGVETGDTSSSRRRRDDGRLRNTTRRSSRDNSRDSRNTEGREWRRRGDADSEGERRRRREESASLQPDADSSQDQRRRRSQEEAARRHELTSRTAARQIEHQSSLRSLISSSDVDSHEMEEEILRQIREEGLLDGIDLENIDVNTEDQISERIAAAFRRRQRERSRAQPARRDASPTMSNGTESRENSGSERLRVSSRRRTHSRSASATRQPNNQISATPSASTARLEVESGGEGRRRRRTTSGGRSATSPVPTRTTETTRPASRSQTDLTDRPRRQSQSQPTRLPVRSTTAQRSGEPDSASPPASRDLQPASFSDTRARAKARSEGSPSTVERQTTSTRSPPPAPIFVPASTPLVSSQSAAQRSPRTTPLSPRHNRVASASDRANAIQSASAPTSSTIVSPRIPLPRFPEPSLTCCRCSKTHIEYDLHYNCFKCLNGNWNICISCYRAGRGCHHWFGFGNAAWMKWEKAVSSGGPSAQVERPHMMTANRYVPPKPSPGGADGRRTLTCEDPQKRLQSGAFCANCLAWANECYWRCDFCNDADWGFCNNCVNQGKCCSHPLLPLTYKPEQTRTPPLSPTHGQPTPTSATLLTGPGVIEFGSFKPLTFRVDCDICHYAIQPSATRFHCFSCTSSVPNCQPGDYDICSNCYYGLVSKKRLSPENGHNGWRRCLQGHRMIIVGFEDTHGGQRRVIIQDLVGGRNLHEEPSKSPEHAGQGLQQWSWANGKQVQLVTTDVAATAPKTSPGLTLTTKFPPDGGFGMKTSAMWPWYPKDGEGENELLFPRGAEIRECVDVNGDWYYGVYMGAKGLFPAPYVKVIEKSAVGT
jgi:hypothetical protein